jgi:hypothetical protein
MYYVDSPMELGDNRENLVDNGVDRCGSAMHDRNLNSARLHPVGVAGQSADDSKTLGGTVSGTS